MAYAKTTRITADTTTSMKLLHGWHFTEATGAAGARVEFRDVDASGDVVFAITLGANETVGETYPVPLLFDDVLHIEVVSGSVVGMVFGG